MTDTQAISEKQQQQESRPLLWTQTTLGKRRIRRARLSFGLAAFISALVLIPLIISGVLQNRNDLGNLCLVLHDDFDGDSLDTSIWQHEVAIGRLFILLKRDSRRSTICEHIRHTAQSGGLTLPLSRKSSASQDSTYRQCL